MNTLKWSRTLCAGNALLLAVVWGIWYGWLAPSEAYGTAITLLGVLPLLVLALAVWGGQVTAMATTGFLSLFYLAHGFTELVANADVRWLATASSLLSLLLFLTASHSLRVHRINRTAH